MGVEPIWIKEAQLQPSNLGMKDFVPERNPYSYSDHLELKPKLYFGFGFQIKQEIGSPSSRILRVYPI